MVLEKEDGLHMSNSAHSGRSRPSKLLAVAQKNLHKTALESIKSYFQHINSLGLTVGRLTVFIFLVLLFFKSFFQFKGFPGLKQKVG